jgi:hypothetical protein
MRGLRFKNVSYQFQFFEKALVLNHEICPAWWEFKQSQFRRRGKEEGTLASAHL